MTARVFDNCRLQYSEDGIARLHLDVRGASVNRISAALIEDLHAALDALRAEGAAPPLILCSDKAPGFAAGLDPAELARLSDPAGAQSLAARGQDLVKRLLAWPQPTAALLHGDCLGGGLEIALAARYRIAEDAAGPGLGFPEIHLGLHPCFGGSARLADLIGMSSALDLVIQGRTLPGAEALRLGLVDACAPPDRLADSAVDLLGRDQGERRPRGLRRILSLASIRWLQEVIRAADDREPIVPESHPATMAMRELWRRHAGRSTAERMRAERESFLMLLRHAATPNYVRIFLNQDRLRNDAREASQPPTRLHVVGAGAIGAQVAARGAIQGIEVSLADQSDTAAEAGMDRARAVFRERLGTGDATAAAASRLTAVEGAVAAGDADFVFEAVDEDSATKRVVFEALESVVPGTPPSRRRRPRWGSPRWRHPWHGRSG